MKIYVDLDGVLADFESKVVEIIGYFPLKFGKNEWKKLHDYPNFFTSLDWMPNGKKIWDGVKKYQDNHEIIILTGTPLGNWAGSQKREWCKQKLGVNIPVITCMSKDKKNWSNSDSILIDDNEKNCKEWSDAGGCSIHYNDKKMQDALISLSLSIIYFSSDNFPQKN